MFKMINFQILLKPYNRHKKRVASKLMARKMESLTLESLVNKPANYANVVVSLTSIASRLGILHLTIRSLLSQTNLPRKIILWLHEDLQNQIPESLSLLQNQIFEIRYSALDCPHGKLVNSLELFPEDCIVTCDDDCMYESNWLRNLYASYENFPNEVIANHCRQISYDQNGMLQPYKKWLHTEKRGVSQENFLALGYAGVLYPPHCLRKEATNPGLFLELAPRADDLWFKAMSLLNGVKVRTSLAQFSEPFEINQSQIISLRRYNVKQDGNKIQWINICNHYKIKQLQHY